MPLCTICSKSFSQNQRIVSHHITSHPDVQDIQLTISSKRNVQYKIHKGFNLCYTNTYGQEAIKSPLKYISHLKEQLHSARNNNKYIQQNILLQKRVKHLESKYMNMRSELKQSKKTITSLSSSLSEIRIIYEKIKSKHDELVTLFEGIQTHDNHLEIENLHQKKIIDRYEVRPTDIWYDIQPLQSQYIYLLNNKDQHIEYLTKTVNNLKELMYGHKPIDELTQKYINHMAYSNKYYTQCNYQYNKLYSDYYQLQKLFIKHLFRNPPLQDVPLQDEIVYLRSVYTPIGDQQFYMKSNGTNYYYKYYRFSQINSYNNKGAYTYYLLVNIQQMDEIDPSFIWWDFNANSLRMDLLNVHRHNIHTCNIIHSHIIKHIVKYKQLFDQIDEMIEVNKDLNQKQIKKYNNIYFENYESLYECLTLLKYNL